MQFDCQNISLQTELDEFKFTTIRNGRCKQKLRYKIGIFSRKLALNASFLIVP